jgi:tRNA (Thr-GGU) A37 N-methylase
MHREGDIVNGRALAEPLPEALTRKHGWTLTWILVISLEPIGVVVGGRTALDDDEWGAVESIIRLDADRFTPDVVTGLDAFSHLCVVFHFHLVDEADIVSGARHPRGSC